MRIRHEEDLRTIRRPADHIVLCSRWAQPNHVTPVRVDHMQGLLAQRDESYPWVHSRPRRLKDVQARRGHSPVRAAVDVDGAQMHVAVIGNGDIAEPERRRSPGRARGVEGEVSFSCAVRLHHPQILENILEDLWVMQADGTGKRHLAFNATSPTWAPSSLRLGYITVADYGDVHLRTVNIDGSADRRVTPPGLNVFQPAWSTMNPRIAFVTLGEKALHVIDPDGSDMVRLSPPGAEDDVVSWSPDGTKILFMTDPHESEQGSNIGVMDSNGSNRRIITDTP